MLLLFLSQRNPQAKPLSPSGFLLFLQHIRYKLLITMKLQIKLRGNVKTKENFAKREILKLTLPKLGFLFPFFPKFF